MSQESKHTPGPHYAVNYAGYINLQTSPYYDGDQREDGGSLDLLDADDVGMDTAEANGRLYAAAPDMLEALELISSSVRFMKDEEGAEYIISNEDMKIIESAIKKAKGL